jgi:hypothetical protein
VKVATRIRRNRRRAVGVFIAIVANRVVVYFALPHSWGWVDRATTAVLVWVSMYVAYATGWLDCHKQVVARVADVVARAGAPAMEALDRAVKERDGEATK